MVVDRLLADLPYAYFDVALDQIRDGNLDLAISLLAELTALDPKFDTSPGRMQLWSEAAGAFSMQDVKTGRELFSGAQLFSTPGEAEVASWSSFDLNGICWWNSLYGYAEDVLAACNSRC